MTKKRKESKQIPYLFVLMSRRTAEDYRKVMKKIEEILVKPAVAEVVSDFERGIWRGVQDVFPEVKMYGCVFHWTQAVFRKLKNWIDIPFQQKRFI